MRNPVINFVSMYTTSDIPDWYYPCQLKPVMKLIISAGALLKRGLSLLKTVWQLMPTTEDAVRLSHLLC
jgi:hypothetical protein